MQHRIQIFFYENKYIQQVKLSDTVLNINDNAFSGCLVLETINFLERLQTIGKYTFKSCEKWDNVYIPKNVKSIGLWAFSNCLSLNNIIIFYFNLCNIYLR